MIFLRNTKKGSYILEASISLPIFMIGVLLLSSIITITARCEGANFMLCDEAEKLMFLPLAAQSVEDRIREEDKLDEVSIYTKDGINKTKTLGMIANIGPKSVFDLNSKVRFTEEVVYRPFVGNTRSALPETAFGIAESYHAVYIFPSSGKKYHKKSCTYVNSYASRVKLSADIKEKYRACRLCGSSKAKLGDMVYLFEYGDDYHLRNCPTIDKFVMEIDIEDARERGYTPCSKCGG